ncbi:MAG: hypothetical protein C0483_14515 [Pirellula sp.]|nr:hypothetical protein [Pirellula sp.]
MSSKPAECGFVEGLANRKNAPHYRQADMEHRIDDEQKKHEKILAKGPQMRTRFTNDPRATFLTPRTAPA